MMTRRSTGFGEYSRSEWDLWVDELQQRAPMWRVFPWNLNTSAWLPQNRPRIYTVGLHASMATRHVLPPPTPAMPCSLLDMLHPGLPRLREVGLTDQQVQNLAIAKGQAKRYSGCLAIVSLDRNPDALWATGFGVHGVINALRTGNDLIWLLQHERSSDRFALSRCLHPIERCALQGFRAEQLAGMSKTGVLRATGNAMSTPVVAAAFKRCMEVLAARLHSGVPRAIALPDEGRERAPNRHQVLAGTNCLAGGPRGRAEELPGVIGLGVPRFQSHRFRGCFTHAKGCPRQQRGQQRRRGS